MSSKIKNILKTTLHFIPDKLYIQLYYFAKFKKKCNLINPITYNEKLNWLKLHDKNPNYIKMADKYQAKKYVADIIGDEYIIPTLGLWKNFDDINFDELPQKFVLKCTHDSNGIVVVKDKNNFDKLKAKHIINTALKQNYFYIGREWPYKNISPCIIAEEYMEDYMDGELRDYKFFCFNGKPKILYIVTGRQSGTPNIDFFDMDFNHLNIEQAYPNSSETLRKPSSFEEMIKLATILSHNIPHVRVDFYEVNGKIYFGELTFYHFSGFVPFKPDKWDKILGDWLQLN